MFFLLTCKKEKKSLFGRTLNLSSHQYWYSEMKITFLIVFFFSPWRIYADWIHWWKKFINVSSDYKSFRFYLLKQKQHRSIFLLLFLNFLLSVTKCWCEVELYLHLWVVCFKKKNCFCNISNHQLITTHRYVRSWKIFFISICLQSTVNRTSSSYIKKRIWFYLNK